MTPHDLASDGSAPADDSAFLEQIVRYQDSALSPAELHAFEAELLQDAAKLRRFAEMQLQSAEIHGLLRQQVYTGSVTVRPADTLIPPAPVWPRWVALLAVLLVVAAGLVQLPPWHVAMPDPPPAGPNPPEEAVPAESVPAQEPAMASGATQAPAAVAPIALTPVVAVPIESETQVRLAGASQARFFGELTPKVQSLLARNRDYVLTSGLVELLFPSGASAIIEGPAVFRVMTDDCLALDTGRCSVHAPDGAEGFRVETPVTRVVDRGTRFSVNVTEGVETEVHVVEGIADVYWKSETAAPSPPSAHAQPAPELPLQLRLEERDARRFSGTEVAAAVPVSFTPNDYRARLPDRIVSYEAQLNKDGHASDLISVTVERGGIRRTYPMEELIPVELTAFKSYPITDRCGHLSGPGGLPGQRASWLSDTALNSGVINPGGSPKPLTTDPVMAPVEDVNRPNTPGFAVRFQSPVINGPGPDVVFFELQTFSNPPDGDAFHVSPLQFVPGRQSHTIRTYDLTLASREVLPLGNFYLYKFETPVSSLTELEEVACTRTQMRLGFRVLAVGIDLSHLGFAEGETVEGLFFQDADDDDSHVDPVLIAGLPAPTPATAPAVPAAGRND